jgi:hypothetical protein
MKRRLPYRPMPSKVWADTIDTIHMWTQIVGKIKLAQMPPVNHWWHVPLYVSSRGLTTNAMPYGNRLFQLDFDFVDHRFVGEDSVGGSFSIDLGPMSVAAFYRSVMEGLSSLSIRVPIHTRPVEVDVAIPFERDEQHATYDHDDVAALWAGLSSAHELLTRFRGGFIGKASPVHFFWGGFDLAVTRFSGRKAPRHPGGVPNCPDWVMEEAYSHEVSSAGWWPGTDETGPSFYSYMYPEPDGFSAELLSPAKGTYNTDLGDWILTDREADETKDPDATVLEFLNATYDSGATMAKWDRAALERR